LINVRVDLHIIYIYINKAQDSDKSSTKVKKMRIFHLQLISAALQGEAADDFFEKKHEKFLQYHKHIL